MDTNKLTYFKTIVDQGHMRRAAETLGLSQPALTLAVQKLEGELGVRLLDRTRAGLTPTHFGEIFYRYAQEVLQDTDRLKAEIGELQGLRTGHVSVALGSSVSNAILARAMEHLRAARPGIRVTLTVGVYFELLPLIKSGKVDLMIGRLPEAKSEPDLTSIKLFDDPYVVYARPQHPLAEKRSCRLSETRDYPWLFARKWADTLLDVSAFLKKMGEPELEPAIDITDKEATRLLLKSDDYLSTWPSQCFADDVASGALVALRMTDFNWHSTVGIAYRDAQVSLTGRRAFCFSFSPGLPRDGVGKLSQYLPRSLLPGTDRLIRLYVGATFEKCHLGKERRGN